ncbi:hypothetical protein QM543_07510 [Pantoea eucrina]|uniref:gp53-like domain-containing protein n=1 Tax=Pantoea eucrina TaxID=472693 RepID=UPI0024B79259|nr:hypothetical protein [Pantoea eucrina]MDJ0023129.1 hypothetical protein [Pantoea eucrina]
MQNSSQPKLLPIPFAATGSKQDIPNQSQIGITAGRASYPDGFPPLTRTPLAAGGIPPFGTDFNGVFNDVTSAIRWTQAGAGYPFNSDFNTAISGYPKGAKIPCSTLDGFWLNTIDGNKSNPEVTGAATTGWVPGESYGVTAITGLSGSSVTLTTLQASKERITLAGTLSANINLIVPAWVKRWTIVNNCSGSFSVTVKTPNGSGFSIASGATGRVIGDGVNINQDFGTSASRDVGTGANQIPDMNSFASTNAVNGQLMLPNGLIIKWGEISTNSATQLVTFPAAFPNLCIFGAPTHIIESLSSYTFAQAVSRSANGISFGLYTANPGAAPVANTVNVTLGWWALGF